MTAPIPAGASAVTRRCPGCTTRVPATDDWCDHCWVRVPFQLAQPVRAAYRRDEDAYLVAVQRVREWLRTHPTAPPPADAPPGRLP